MSFCTQNLRRTPLNARLYRSALGADAQPTVSHAAALDIDDDEIEDEFSFTLDPELQQIARQSKLQNRNKMKGVYSREASEAYEERPGADEDIRMSIKWVPHPQDPNGLKVKEWDKKMLRVCILILPLAHTILMT